MIIADVMAELGDALDTITGLRVYPYPGESFSPPGAVVRFPTRIDFDGTMARGMDRARLFIDVIVAPVVSRTAPDELSPYVSGSGPASVKATIEGYGSYTAFDVVTVEEVEFEDTLIGDVPYINAVFTVDVVGPGT